MNQIEAEQLRMEIAHIFDSGANEIRIFEMVKSFAEIQKQEEKLFTTALRTMAEPPIKGEITKGKTTWRGIRLIRQQVGFDSYSWLEQRGKQISPKFHIEAKLPDLNVG
jgi:hypothetical protein